MLFKIYNFGHEVVVEVHKPKHSGSNTIKLSCQLLIH